MSAIQNAARIGICKFGSGDREEDFNSSHLAHLHKQENWEYNRITKDDIVFANGPEDQGSNPGRVIPKTLKMVFDTSLLNTQQYKGMYQG